MSVKPIEQQYYEELKQKNFLSPEENKLLEKLKEKYEPVEDTIIVFDYSIEKYKPKNILEKYLDKAWEKSFSYIEEFITKHNMHPVLHSFIDIPYHKTVFEKIESILSCITKLEKQNIFREEYFNDELLKLENYLYKEFFFLASHPKSMPNTLFNIELLTYCLWLIAIDMICEKYKVEPDYYVIREANILIKALYKRNFKEIITNFQDMNLSEELIFNDGSVME